MQPRPKPQIGVAGTGGAIGAVAKSLEQLNAQSIVDIDTGLIDASFIADRLEQSEEHHRQLVDSIRRDKQQVPILVRPHPAKEGRFQIAYGRRRLQALKELGWKIRAVVRPLTDAELVVAQGQENSARKDLTFIEKALFASRLEKAGYGREDTIVHALSVDKTALSRLISVAEKIPADLIEAVGPAPAIGRDRWLQLVTRLERAGAVARARTILNGDGFSDIDTDQRFERVFEGLAPKAPKPAKPLVLKSADGAKFGQATDTAQQLTLTIGKKDDGAFAAHLLEMLPKLHAEFMEREGKT